MHGARRQRMQNFKCQSTSYSYSSLPADHSSVRKRSNHHQTMKLSLSLLFLSAGTASARVGSAADKPADAANVNGGLDAQKELFSSWVAEHKGATTLQSAYKNPEELTRRMNIWMQNHGA